MPIKELTNKEAEEKLKFIESRGEVASVLDKILTNSQDLSIDYDSRAGYYSDNDPPEVYDVSLVDSIKHSYKKLSLFGSLYEGSLKYFETSQFKEDPEFDSYQYLKDRKNLAAFDQVGHAQSQEEIEYLLERIDRMNNEDAFYGSGKWSGLANFASMLGAPENHIPIIAPFARGRSVTALAKNLAFNSAIFTGIATADLYADDRLETDQVIASAMLTAGAMSVFGTILSSPTAAQIRKDSLRSQIDEILTEKVPDDVRAGEAYYGDETYKNSVMTDAELYEAGEFAKGSSVGSMQAPGAKPKTREQIIDEESLVGTGIGLEKLGLTPNIRLSNYPSETTRILGPMLVGQGGLVRKKNLEIIKDEKTGKIKSFTGEETDVSVETENAVKYIPKISENVKTRQDLYLKYRGRIASESAGLNQIKVATITVADFASSKIAKKEKNFLSFREFDEEVTKANRNLDKHEIPEVQAAAEANRKLLDEIGKEAEELGLFSRHLERTLSSLEKREKYLQKLLDKEIKKNKELVNKNKQGKLFKEEELKKEIDEIRSQANLTKQSIDRIKKYGPSLSGAKSYFPRIWRVDKILKNEAAFKQKLINKFKEPIYKKLYAENNHRLLEAEDKTARANIIKEIETIAFEEAKKNAEDVFNNIVYHDKPYVQLHDDKIIESVMKETSSMISRTLKIDDFEWAEYLENSADALMRFYVRSNSILISMEKKFGDFTLKPWIDDIREEFDELIKNAKNHKERDKFMKMQKQAIADVRGIRDRLLGTYGMSEDPYTLTSRFVRAAKIVNILTMLGGAVVSSLTDPARIIMTEGLADTFDYGFRSLLTKQKRALRKMSKRELNLTGAAHEMTLNLRSLQLMDVGDMAGRRYKFERGLHNAQGAFFFLNGLNWWTTLMKENAAIVISAKIIDSAMDFANGTIKPKHYKRLKAYGLSDEQISKIAEYTKKYGEAIKIKGDKDMWMPNTMLWEDEEVAKAFRYALHDGVERTIVTPNAGDRALWTSTEYGSLVTQFMSFGQASFTKTLVSGLQEKDAAFYTGVVALVGMGMFVNEIKRMQYGIEEEQSLKGKIMDGISRSGVLAIFDDVNTKIETLTNNQIGLRPLIGEAPRWKPSDRNKMGALFGPTGSQVQNALEFTTDILTPIKINKDGEIESDIDKYTGRRFKRMLPLQNHPVFDPIYDAIIPQ